MTSTEILTYKRADQPSEMRQIYRLNYATFVEQIPQHEPNDAGMLVDRFDDENAYFICRRGEAVVGMVAVRGNRPWSLDAKLAEVDRYLPAGIRFCELRLLAIHPEYRGGMIFRGLMSEVARHCIAKDYTGAVISGAVRQQRLYEHLGFVPFGPQVGTTAAPYQPMFITLDALRDWRVGAVSSGTGSPVVASRPFAHSFLPGPVDCHPDVLAALAEPPISHRSAEFLTYIEVVRQTLRAIVRASEVQILLGSGTLANDVVAGQLASLGTRGLVLSNGEFGERLIDHARRAGLSFDCVEIEWGVPFDAARIDECLAGHVDARWIWMVHVETSTGVRNDLDFLTARAEARGTLVAADCISSVGVVPVDARRLHLASSVSGKGLGSLAGMSMVFHRGPLSPSPRLPRYLDLSLYEITNSVPFTQSSNLVRALGVAARATLLRGRFSELEVLAQWFRAELRVRGYSLVAPDEAAAPSIVTIALDPSRSSMHLGEELGRLGMALSYRSEYLRRRNWIQIALMGECSRAKLRGLLAALA